MKSSIDFEDGTICRYENTILSSLRVALPQLLAVMIRNIAVMTVGLTMVFPTILIPGVSGHDSDEIFYLNEQEISWISSIEDAFITVGCVLSGIVVRLTGVKRTMQLVTIPLTVSWFILKFSNSVWQLYLALALIGLAQGVQQAACVLYPAEIAQPHLRGMLVATGVVLGNLGPLLECVLAVYLKWRSIALFNGIVPLACFCLLFLVPESPYWLIAKERQLEARKSLAWLRGWSTLADIEPEFQEIAAKRKCKNTGIDNMAFENSSHNVNELGTPETMKKSSMQLSINQLKNFTKKEFLWPLSLVSFAYFLGNFCGVTTTQVYAVEILATFKISIDKYEAIVFMAIAGIFGFIAFVILIRYLGKRVLSFISIIGCGYCFIVLATYAHIGNIKYLSIHNATAFSNDTSSNNNLANYTWIPLTFVILSSGMASLALVPLPWMLAAEVFPKETKSVGCGLSISINFMLAFLTNKVFLQIVSNLTLPGTYWMYGCVCFLGFLVLYFVLPETEGKSLQEITDHFAGVSKLNKKMQM